MAWLLCLLAICPLCGDLPREDARFCTSCGVPVRDAEEAFRAAEDRVAREPENPKAWFARALAHAGRKQWAGARVDLDRAIELDAFQVPYFVMRGRVRLKLESSEPECRAAVEDLSQALRLDTRNIPARVVRAEALLRIAHYRAARGEDGAPYLAAAILFLEEAVECDPKSVRNWIRLGELRAFAGDLAKALLALDRAVDAGPTAAARTTRARILIALRRLDAALADADEAVQLEPENPTARIVRAEILLALGRASEAAADGSEVLKAHPDHADAWIVRGRARLLLDSERALAAGDFTKALALRPNDPDILALRGSASFATAHFDAAIADWQRAIELRPALRTRLAPSIEEARRKRGTP